MIVFECRVGTIDAAGTSKHPFTQMYYNYVREDINVTHGEG